MNCFITVYNCNLSRSSSFVNGCNQDSSVGKNPDRSCPVFPYFDNLFIWDKIGTLKNTLTTGFFRSFLEFFPSLLSVAIAVKYDIFPTQHTDIEIQIKGFGCGVDTADIPVIAMSAS